MLVLCVCVLCSPSLLLPLAIVCGRELHDVEAKEKGEVTVVEGHDKALKAVHLDEPWAQVHLGCVGGEQEQ